MDIESLRKYCLEMPLAAENMQWGDNLCLKVGGKLFAILSLDSSPVQLSFKCSPETFAELCEREGIKPAPYLARASWVALEHLSVLPDAELRELLAEAHHRVMQNLPQKRLAELEASKKAAGARAQTAGKPKEARKKQATPSLRPAISTKAKAARRGR